MIEIPKQLCDENYRFVLLGNKSKVPFETNWQNTGYKYNDEKLIEHLNNGGNFGVICGYGGLVVIDIDDHDEAETLIKEFSTFTIKTGSGRGIHIYLKTLYNTNHVFKDGKGELRAMNYQVVGPNCINQSGGKYEIINDIEILEIDKNELLKKINYLIVKNKDINYKEQIDISKEEVEIKILPKLSEFIRTLITRDSKEYVPSFYGFPSRSERDQKVIVHLLLKGFGMYVQSIFKQFPIGDKYREHSNGDLYLKKNIERGREYSGISEDLSISLEEEISNLNERVLRNKIDFYLKQIVNLEKWSEFKYLIGLIAFKTKISKKDLEKRADSLEEEKIQKQHFFSAQDILKLDTPEIEFFVENLIPKNSLILMQGKPGQFKSMFVLLLCLAMKSKQPFLGKFEIKETPKIIYYDLENELYEIKKRMQYGIKGFNLSCEEALNGFHFEKNFKKLSKASEIEKCKEFDIIVLDSFRRFLDGDDSKSEITNKFYLEFLKPLLELNKTIILILHEKKGAYENYDYEGGRMEMIRGSGDIGAQADLCLAITKNGETQKIGTRIRTIDLNLSVEKNRKGLELEEFNFQAEKDDDLKQTTLKFGRTGKPPRPKERLIKQIFEYLENKEKVKRSDLVTHIKNKSTYSEVGIIKILKELTEDGQLFQPEYGSYSLKENISEKNIIL